MSNFLTRWTPMPAPEGMQDVNLGAWALLVDALGVTPGALPHGANAAWIGGPDNSFYYAFDDPMGAPIGILVPANTFVKVPNQALLKSMWVLDGGTGRPVACQFFTGRVGSAR